IGGVCLRDGGRCGRTAPARPERHPGGLGPDGSSAEAAHPPRAFGTWIAARARWEGRWSGGGRAGMRIPRHFVPVRDRGRGVGDVPSSWRYALRPRFSPVRPRFSPYALRPRFSPVSSRAPRLSRRALRTARKINATARFLVFFIAIASRRVLIHRQRSIDRRDRGGEATIDSDVMSSQEGWLSDPRKA